MVNPGLKRAPRAGILESTLALTYAPARRVIAQVHVRVTTRAGDDVHRALGFEVTVQGNLGAVHHLLVVHRERTPVLVLVTVKRQVHPVFLKQILDGELPRVVHLTCTFEEHGVLVERARGAVRGLAEARDALPRGLLLPRAHAAPPFFLLFQLPAEGASQILSKPPHHERNPLLLLLLVVVLTAHVLTQGSPRSPRRRLVRRELPVLRTVHRPVPVNDDPRRLNPVHRGQVRVHPVIHALDVLHPEGPGPEERLGVVRHQMHRADVHGVVVVIRLVRIRHDEPLGVVRKVVARLVVPRARHPRHVRGDRFHLRHELVPDLTVLVVEVVRKVAALHQRVDAGVNVVVNLIVDVVPVNLLREELHDGVRALEPDVAQRDDAQGWSFRVLLLGAPRVEPEDLGPPAELRVPNLVPVPSARG